ncbi:putative toxin-antitoxin system toxin component, PIN family [Undibacterium amnicola]|uniref:Toxin-antitoxin system toxin component, PIN family n=1 Tax=Undibacterium amnicola TaxID=1834038 RepID=A0ABR6XNK3_9BURK|nr:putative toxin-antitoxin system toxin component, PIN family [Undibacterium amnicola]MBC3830482.1 putative toxin-antitoxin system toxin component, PIN family [Undibacterium amnicola]
MSLKIVLDTNVCLDLFVFKDPRWQQILEGLQNKELNAITREDCRDEWLAVLNYPHLPVNDENRERIVSSFDEYILLEKNPTKEIKLPACSDKDDQKFLETSRDAEAKVLVTKDKALLKLARKIQNMNLFIIETPEKFVARLVAKAQVL